MQKYCSKQIMKANSLYFTTPVAKNAYLPYIFPLLGFVSIDSTYGYRPLWKKWGSKVVMLLGSFEICWHILSENAIFTYKDNFCSNKSCQNTNCALPCKTWGSIVAMLLGSFHGLVKFVGRFFLKIPVLPLSPNF